MLDYSDGTRSWREYRPAEEVFSEDSLATLRGAVVTDEHPDALACARCGGRMRWIAVIRDRAVIVRILEYIGEESALPRIHRARDPC